MARTVRVVGGESPIALIIFIITTVAGAAGCFFLYSAYNAKKTALESIESNIDFAIASRLERSDDTREEILKRIDNSPEALTRYGDEFFTLVARVTDYGVKYIQLAKLCGWPAETAAPYIDENNEVHEGDVALFLQRPENQPAESLRQLIRMRDAKIAQLTSTLNETRQKLELAQDALNKEREVREQQVQQLQKQITDLKNALAAKDQEMKKMQADLKAQIDKEHQAALQALDQLTKGKEELDKQRKELVKMIDEAIGMIRTQLERRGRRPKTPPPLPDATIAERFQVVASLVKEGLAPSAVAEEKGEMIGRVLRIDYDTGYAYISLGEIDGVRKGELFTIYEQGRAGRKIIKALVEIVDVEETVSTAGVLESDPRNPVIRGDYVIRSEAMIPAEKPAAAAPAEKKAEAPAKAGG